MQPSTKPSIKVRTHLRAGGECWPWDTNCVAMYAGAKAMNDNGTPVWDNCNNGQLFAGSSCIDAVSNSKFVGKHKENLADCMQC